MKNPGKVSKEAVTIAELTSYSSKSPYLTNLLKELYKFGVPNFSSAELTAQQIIEEYNRSNESRQYSGTSQELVEALVESAPSEADCVICGDKTKQKFLDYHETNVPVCCDSLCIKEFNKMINPAISSEGEPSGDL